MICWIPDFDLADIVCCAYRSFPTKAFPVSQILSRMRGVKNGRVLNFASMVASGSRYFLVIPVSGPDKSSVFLIGEASLCNVVRTAVGPAVAPAVHEGRVRFIATCLRRWSDEANDLSLRTFYLIVMFVRCRRRSRILNRHQPSCLKCFTTSLCIVSHLQASDNLSRWFPDVG